MNGVLTVLVFIISLVSLGAVKFRCDYTFTISGWFKYHDIPANWHDARLRCRYEGGMLAAPTTPRLKAEMEILIRDVDVFTGYHATLSRGSYRSIDGKPFSAIAHTWAATEPDSKNDNERCIAMNSEGNFSDVNCDEPRPYICHRPTTAADANICGVADPEYYFETRTNKCYKLHTTPRNFKRAHFVCDAEGGHLAIINSQAEFEVLRDLFARYPDYKIIGNIWKDVAFIGFHNFEESQDWTTLDGQTLKEAGFDMFQSGEPNNSTEGEYCGSIYRTGYLNDLWCEKHFAFICEKAADYPELCNSDDFDEENSNRPR